MRSHVVFLRGINVGGHNRVPMADLRAVVEGLGHGDVATYLQSGNVVFRAAGPGAPEVGAITAALAERLGVSVAGVITTRDALDEVIINNPFPEETDPKRVHVIFHSRLLTEDEAAARTDERGQDRAQVFGSVVYLHTPGGFGRSDLAVRLTRPPAASSDLLATARNWSTVLAVRALLG